MNFFLKLYKFFNSDASINTVEISNEIITLLQKYNYQGLVNEDCQINSILKQLFWNKRKYINVYKFSRNNETYYLIDSKYSNKSLISVRENLLCYFGVNCNFNFEVTDDGENLFNPDCSEVTKVNGFKIYCYNQNIYQQYSNLFQTILNHPLSIINRNPLPPPVIIDKTFLLLSYTQGSFSAGC